MWDELKTDDRDEYKRMILALASLSEMFAQKSETEDGYSDDGEGGSSAGGMAPIISSKYQETVFQKAFGASAEDVGNTSFDAAIDYSGVNGKKYLVGIKTFGIGTRSQKVAQFKSNMTEWEGMVNDIKKAALNADGDLMETNEINGANAANYLKLAKAIAELRNTRIASSEAKLRGLSVDEDDDVDRVYHVLMPSKKNDPPAISVGETDYSMIDVDNITVTGCKSKKTPVNFGFTDGKHDYRYTAADCQLYMDFNNKAIVRETWKVKYADDAYDVLGKLADAIYEPNGQHGGNVVRHVAAAAKAPVATGLSQRPKVVKSFSWSLINDHGEVAQHSGFNAFNGLGSKLGRERKVTENKLKTLKKECGPRCDFAIEAWDSLQDKNDKANVNRCCVEIINSAKEECKRTGRYELYSSILKAFGNQRDTSIWNLRKEYADKVDKKVLDEVDQGLSSILLGEPRTLSAAEKADARRWLMYVLGGQRCEAYRKAVMGILYRPQDELYIPIPAARKFHETYPDFFGKGVSEFKEKSNKLARPKEDRRFNLVFEPSGDSMTAFISQDDGKGISSYSQQTLLGEWLLRRVFQLKPYEPLTVKRLNELGINGMRLFRTDGDDSVHLEFIWIDDENLPEDYWGD